LICLYKSLSGSSKSQWTRQANIGFFFINQLPRIFQEFSKDFYFPFQRRYSALDISPNRNAEKLIQSNKKLGCKRGGRNNRTVITETVGDK
jgi:hypothetical protein